MRNHSSSWPEKLCHIFDQVIVHAKMHYSIFEVSELFLWFQQACQFLLEFIVPCDQISDVHLLLYKLFFKCFDLFLAVSDFILIVVFHRHLIFIHQDFDLCPLLFDSRTGFELHRLDKSVPDPKLNHHIFMVSFSILKILLKFDILLL